MTSLQEGHKTALSDLESLGRVSHRLAMTAGGLMLERVLEKLLPRLLQRIGSNHQVQLELQKQQQASDLQRVLEETHSKIHAKLVEMLSHTMKRVRADGQCKLPCLAILQLLFEEEENPSEQTRQMSNETNDFRASRMTLKGMVDPFTLNLALAFLTLGLPRCTLEQVEELIPGLMMLVGAHSGTDSLLTASRKAQSHQLHHLLLRAIEKAVVAEKEQASSKSNHFETQVKAARQVCRQSSAGGAVYDLLLDVLLYYPINNSNSNMPPMGLSPAGRDRLVGGASLTAKNWAAEMASTTRLKDLKVALMDYIAPNRRWALFMGEKNQEENNEKEDNDNEDEENNPLGVTRTVALLVASSGDGHFDVSERAKTYLKTHLDSMRQRAPSTNATKALGAHPLLLSCHLLSLALGESNSEGALVQAQERPELIRALGISVETTSQTSTAEATVVMSMKRRIVSEKCSFAILNFIAARVLDDNPQLLESDDTGESLVMAFASLVASVTNHFLLTMGNSSATTTRISNSPQVAASKLLNSITVRLASYYDNNKDSSEEHGNLIRLLSRSLSIACSVLASSSGSSGEGSVTMRDACFGVVCTLARSQFAMVRKGGIFTCGAPASESSTAKATIDVAVSIETAALLFGCASNEVETLRPRAVAALDALLASYCRVYNNTDSTQELRSPTRVETEEEVPSNPWSQIGDPTRMRTDAESITYAVNNKKGLSKALLPMLWAASQTSQPKASRVAAARWSSDLLKTLDLPSACHILCFLAGDADVTASNIARLGLGLSTEKQQKDVDDDISKNGDSSLPDFSDLTTILFDSDISAGANNTMSFSTWKPQYLDFTQKGKAASLRFGLMCLYNDLYGGEDDAVEKYVRALTETLSWFASTRGGAGRESIDLLDECSVCLAGCLSTSKFARSMIVSGKLPFGLADMEALAVSADSSKARRHLAEASRHIYQDYNLWCDRSENPADDTCSLCDWVLNSNVIRAMEVCSGKLTDMQSNLFMVGEVHGAAFLGASCVRSFRLLAASGDNAKKESVAEAINARWGFSETILSALGRGTLHSDEVIGNACSQSLVIALSYDNVDAPILNERLYSGCATALSSLNVALRKYGNGDNTDPIRASSIVEATGMVLAATTSGAGYVSSNSLGKDVELGPARIQCLDALFSVLGSSSFRKDEEIALTTGEALGLYSDSFSPDGAVWTFAPTEWPEDYDENYANDLPPHQQVLYILLKRELNSSSPHKKSSCAIALLALAARAAKLVNGNVKLSKRAFVSELLQRLDDVQSAFLSLLSFPKSKQLARESCCLGLAACQGLADAISTSLASGDSANHDSVSLGLNERLLKAFGQTTNYGGSAMMETRAQEADRRRRENTGEATAVSMTESFGMESGLEIEVGGASGLGEAALGAYREMAAAAVALGRPDVLYALMLLSVSHPVWFRDGPRDRYNAASLLGENSIAGNRTNAAEIRDALRPHLQKLIPRLLRACNDPNKQTREQMGTLWVGLTGGGAESRLAISQHLLSTTDALVEDASNKLWRARVGACGALANVIVGRSWDDLGGGGPIFDDEDVLNPTRGAASTAAIRLLRLWRAAMRALDDVRGSVRESGETLARSVRSLTIRLCDPTAIKNSAGEPTSVAPAESKVKIERDAAAAAATALRWLVRHGLNQACSEATGVCVSCLLGVVDVVQPKQLEPVLPELIGSLLMAMSGLEPSALNYLQARTAGQSSSPSTEGAYDRLERIRLQIAQTGPISGALTKCLDMMRSVEADTQKAVVPQLDSALRRGAGFATRAAAADAVSSLCATCPGAFKFSGQSSTNPTVRLLRALYFASERERGLGARDKMAHALGNLAGVSPGPSVRILALRACERYTSSQGNNDDPAARRAAAAALRAMAVRATAQFAIGGGNDIWCRRVLPVAFLGQRDTDAKVASLWKEVWEEGGSAANESARSSSRSDSFGVLLEEKLLPYLVRACVEALEDVSWSRRIAGCASLVELADLNVLAPAPRSAEPNVLENVESEFVSRAKGRAQAANTALVSCMRLIVRSRIWAGKADVVRACVKVASKWTSVGEDSITEKALILGWEVDDGSKCVWSPLLLSLNAESSDLFVGDHWFEEGNRRDDEPQTNETVDMDVTEENGECDLPEESAPIDFNDCEEILEDMSSPTGTDVVEALEEKPAVLTLKGLCRALLDQGMPSVPRSSLAFSPDDVLPYRAACLEGLSDLLKSLSSSEGPHLLPDIYRMIATKLVGVIARENHFGIDSVDQSEQPPLLVARSIDCLASAMWDGICKEDMNERTKLESTVDLSKMFRTAGGDKQSAWTVRESSALAAATLAAKCDLSSLRKLETVSILLDCTVQAMKDRKFWRVRYAGLKLLYELVCRAGSTKDNSTAFSIAGRNPNTASAAALDRQLLLEALLPHKEKILKFARSSLTDSESKVTAIGTDVCSVIAWWP